jgi:hypothetical protein
MDGVYRIKVAAQCTMLRSALGAGIWVPLTAFLQVSHSMHQDIIMP